MTTASNLRRFRVAEVFGALVLLSYYLKFASKNESYDESRYWYGTPSRTVVFGAAPVQIVSAVSALLWARSIRRHPADRGLLSYKLFGEPMSEVLMTTFTASSAAWPWLLVDPPLNRSKLGAVVLSCVPLWIAGISGLLAQAGTSESNTATPTQLASIALFNATVFSLDAVGWSGRVIHKTLYD